jgi:hypothetical protein
MAGRARHSAPMRRSYPTVTSVSVHCLPILFMYSLHPSFDGARTREAPRVAEVIIMIFAKTVRAKYENVTLKNKYVPPRVRLRALDHGSVPLA